MAAWRGRWSDTRCGSTACRSALAMRVQRRAWFSAAASWPAKSQFLRPIATRFNARSAALLSMLRKPCVT